jgi:ATP-dependent DNA helicase PIF1
MLPEIEEIMERYQQLDTTQVGQNLDAEGEKDNVESMDLGMKENEKLSFLKAYDLSEVQKPVSSSHNTYAAYNAITKEEIFEKARTLSWDQQLAFQIIIKYYKQCLKNYNGNKQKPNAPLLFIHGAGGSGKSMLINLLSDFGEHYFRKIKAGSQHKPVVQKTAPTGKAASNIGGYTLHSTFSLSFGNKFMSLNDEKKATLSAVLEDLQVLFKDEISMVKPDLLYQLHLRLKEVKNVDKPFGNVCIIILGDLMQLKPVQGNYVFDMPRCIDFKNYHSQWPLFEQFLIVELITNHRQGCDKKYAELLERVRFGKQTEEDMELLQSRVITEDNPICKNALMIYGTNAAVNRFNAKMLASLPADEEKIEAIKIPPKSNKYYRFPVNKEGLIAETTFYDILILKNESFVMLTYNVNTGDKLTNGQLGKITQIIKSSSTKEVICIIVEFEDKSVGQQQKEKYKKYSEFAGVPIFRINFTYSIGKCNKDHIASAQIIQFPLKLAWALTCHKVQGQTVKKPNKLVSDVGTIFQANQAYVVLSRVQSIEQIYFTRCPSKKIYCSDVCRKTCDKLKQKSLNETSNFWVDNPSALKVSSINIRSLSAHIEDLKKNYVILQSDIICLQETWIEKCEDLNKYTIDGFQLICASHGKGKGAAMYLRKSLQAKTETFSNMSVQLVKMEHDCFDLITVYFNCKTDIEEAISYMTKNMNKEKKTFIVGDFNTGTTQKLEFLLLKMNQIGFQLLLNEATHESGNTLDNLITNAKDIRDLNLFLYSLYFTDMFYDVRFCICVTKPK